jgi:hypothetical protein
VNRAHALVLIVAALVLGATSAAGQPKAPAAPSALPAGHPPVAPDGEEEDDAPPNPHANGAAQANDPRFFNPPEDTVAEDASLPAGTIVVTIKDAQDRPLPRMPITLGILHSTVAKGDSSERQAREGDEGGSARFEGLASGSGHTYRLSTTRGSATYAHPPFPLSAKAGKRVTLHSYEVSANADELPIAMQAAVYVSLREDAIQVEQLVTVFNLGPVAWLGDATIELPRGFKAFNKQDSMDDARIEEVPGTGAALRGTFPPGRRELDFRYQVPLDDEAKQTLRLRLPKRVAQARVIAEASRSMALDVSGWKPATRVDGRDGKHLLVTEHQAERAQGGVTSLEITLSGLPTPGPGRWIAVVLAVIAFGSGVLYFATTGSGLRDEDARRDLAEAREALLGELVALERARKSGEVGPKTHARVRASLLDALARIITMIDDAAPGKKKPVDDGGRAPKKPPTRRMESSA